MPFGLSRAPATFQKAMDIVLRPIIYLDDIIVTSETLDEHVKRLKEVFALLNEAGFKINARKCKFAAKELRYLCKLREVDDFKKLCDLIVSDKLYETLDSKKKEHISVREGQSWYPPNQLGRECDLFYSSRGKSLVDTSNTRIETPENKKLNFSKNNLRKAQSNFKDSGKFVNQGSSKPERICYVCGSKGELFHFARNCPKRLGKEESLSPKKVSGLEIDSDNAARNKLEFIELLIDGKKVKCLIDSRSELIVVKKSLFPNKLSSGCIELKSSFGHVVKAETAKLIFSLCESKKQKEIEAAMVDGLITDCIFPPSCLKMICCDQMMNTQYENDSVSSERNFLSFISATIEADSETDLWHIKDEGLRNTVSTLINEYKPLEKPRSTDLKMKVILKDDIPVS
ncbi:uncharacterized protein LOC118194646 [Stegodyphus dumicola]|uniref:uncharacterized protein LOC118194646 n=1 Tax=Stegodyphus dumicola TaxID=202533 RepID=UPI0015A83E8E|nr:uncharacterized protein LOC118194646 [Stegodyphus dumicola]